MKTKQKDCLSPDPDLKNVLKYLLILLLVVGISDTGPNTGMTLWPEASNQGRFPRQCGVWPTVTRKAFVSKHLKQLSSAQSRQQFVEYTGKDQYYSGSFWNEVILTYKPYVIISPV